MNQAFAITADAQAFDLLSPPSQMAPLVLASPHSGREYPAEFIGHSRLDLSILRKSEDSFVDELFAGAVECGIPLLRARFPRAYVDPNREPFELDPAMFDGPLPHYVNIASPRVAAGLGTIAKVVANGELIYRSKLNFPEICQRIETFYRPYHAALRSLLDQTRGQFGFATLIDCHSMPSIGGPMETDSGRGRVDFVLGDCHGRSCARGLIEAADKQLSAWGYRVERNTPYSGGFTTQHYGRPSSGVHAMQIEINRALYMDERRYRRGPHFARLKHQLAELTISLAKLQLEQ